MNDLSWMIYLAGAAGSVKTVLGFAAFLLFVGFLAWPIKNQWIRDFGDDSDIRPTPKWLLPVSLTFAIMAAFTPSSNTVYAIAASETGEAALNSDTGSKAVQALDAWLDRQIDGGEQ